MNRPSDGSAPEDKPMEIFMAGNRPGGFIGPIVDPFRQRRYAAADRQSYAMGARAGKDLVPTWAMSAVLVSAFTAANLLLLLIVFTQPDRLGSQASPLAFTVLYGWALLVSTASLAGLGAVLVTAFFAVVALVRKISWWLGR